MSSFRREFVRDGEKVAVRVEHVRDDCYRVRVGERTIEVRARALEDGAVQFAVVDGDGEPSHLHTAYSAARKDLVQVRVDGRTWDLDLAGSRRSGSAQKADGQVFAPMTGTVLKVNVQAGDSVEPDQTLVVLSAMKMEHKLTAGVAGTVIELEVAEGDTVDQGHLLVKVEPATGPS